MYIYICVYVYKYMCMYVYVYIYVYMYMYMYMYIYGQELCHNRTLSHWYKFSKVNFPPKLARQLKTRLTFENFILHAYTSYFMLHVYIAVCVLKF